MHSLRQRAHQPLAIVIALLAMVVLIPERRITMLGIFMVFVGLAISLDLLVGDTGLLGMGHMAFFGGGAYVSTLLHQEAGLGMPLSAVLAIIVVALLALLIGYPATSRTSGLYFAIVTFAFGMLLVLAVNNTTSISGGSEGLPVDWGIGSDFPFDWTIARYLNVWIALLLGATVALAGWIRTSQFGLRLRAIRASEDLVKGLGIGPTFQKTAIFVLASAVAGAFGTLYAPMVGFINPHVMGVNESIALLGIVYVGGLRSRAGAFIGVLLLSTLPIYLQLSATARPILVGLAMAAVVLLAPDRGIAGAIGAGVVRLRSRCRVEPLNAATAERQP